MDKHQIAITTLKSGLKSVIENSKINEQMVDHFIYDDNLPDDLKENLRVARARFFQARFCLTSIIEGSDRNVRIS